MTLRKKMPRVAICGASGIGKVHAHIFHTLGAKICAVLGSTDGSAADTVRMLKDLFGITTVPFSCFKTLLNETRPDAVSICTPPHCHFEEILISFDHNIPVFCEKPLFWHVGITREEVEEKLARIETHANRRLFLNTSNANFIDCVIEKIGKQKNIRSFSFRYYTQGKYSGSDIAYDLLPHGLSLLLRLFGPMEIRDLTKKISGHTYYCRFHYGDCAVEFDFREDPGKPKSFIFGLDGRKFTRVQEGSGNTYRVFLEDNHTGEKIEVQDPFQAYIGRFLGYCNNCAPIREDGFDEAATNLRLMAKIILEDCK